MSATHPKLASRARLRWDEREKAHMIVYPERGLVLNATAAEIVKLCDGTRTEADIVMTLSSGANETRETIERDVHALLERLRDKRVVE
ncbi:MAG TPA: pyrroloquinoline quinone biosynthesis peptide chaperone PqqD [Polyangiaceae bacterium]|nr:pyrroloquinoline quinone biosynthesis peptide chaperone PqqD [Polyangiaceae bacterium]